MSQLSGKEAESLILAILAFEENDKSKSQTLVKPVSVWHGSIGIDENAFSIGDEMTQLVNVVVLGNSNMLDDPFGVQMQRNDGKNILQRHDASCCWEQADELRHWRICYTKCKILGGKVLWWGRDQSTFRGASGGNNMI